MKNFALTALSLLFLFSAIGCGRSESTEELNGAKKSVPRAEQSPLDRLDAELAGMYRLMREKSDSLPAEYSDTFKLRLYGALADSATFHYPFDSLRAGYVNIVESDDRKVRIFWWNDPHSGTFRHYPAVIQYWGSNGRYHVYDLDPAAADGNISYATTAYAAIYHLADSTYLNVGVGQIWSGAVFENLFPVVLSDTGMVVSDLPFHVGDSIYTSISLDKNWYFHHMEQFGNTVPLLSAYDSASRILTFPAIVDTNTGEFYNNVLAAKFIQPSGDTIRLHFNGKFFEPAAEN